MYSIHSGFVDSPPLLSFTSQTLDQFISACQNTNHLYLPAFQKRFPVVHWLGCHPRPQNLLSLWKDVSGGDCTGLGVDSLCDDLCISAVYGVFPLGEGGTVGGRYVVYTIPWFGITLILGKYQGCSKPGDCTVHAFVTPRIPRPTGTWWGCCAVVRTIGATDCATE